MTNSMNITTATEIEDRYYAMLNTKSTSKDWHDMALELEDAAERLVCVASDDVKARLLEKAEDCHTSSRKLARGAHELYTRRPDTAPTCWFVVLTDLSPNRGTVMAAIPGGEGRQPSEVESWMDNQPTRALKVVFGAKPNVGDRLYR